MTAVMAKWLAWQIAVLNGACSRLTMNEVFQSGAGHHTAQLSINGITVPTESIVNSVKMVNMPLAWLPHLKEGKSLGILLFKIMTKMNAKHDLV